MKLRGILCVDNHIGRNSALICIHVCVNPRCGIGIGSSVDDSVESTDPGDSIGLVAFLGFLCNMGKHLWLYSTAYS